MAFPASLSVAIKLDDNPRYAGSTHDNETARRMGFKAALVPGAFVYGHISRLAVEAWGADWLKRGAIGARFRRPVYDGDALTVTAGDLTCTDDGVRADVSVRNADGEDVATGWIALPDLAPAPPVRAGLLTVPHPNPRIAVSAGGMPVGQVLGTRDAVLTAEDVAISMAAFQETHPIYADAGVVHSGCLMRLAMGDTNQTFAFPSPVVLVSVEAQHFRAVRAGQRLATAGTVAEIYERKGRHYFVSDETLLADGHAAAHFRRTQIYG